MIHHSHADAAPIPWPNARAPWGTSPRRRRSMSTTSVLATGRASFRGDPLQSGVAQGEVWAPSSSFRHRRRKRAEAWLLRLSIRRAEPDRHRHAGRRGDRVSEPKQLPGNRYTFAEVAGTAISAPNVDGPGARPTARAGHACPRRNWRARFATRKKREAVGCRFSYRPSASERRTVA